MRSLCLIFISLLVLASCSSSTTSPNAGIEQALPPTSDSIYIDYSGARTGTMRLVRSDSGHSDSMVVTAKVIRQLNDTTGVGFFILQDTVPNSSHEGTGLSLVLGGRSPLTAGQSFSAASSSRHAAATIAFSAEQTGIPPLVEASGFAPGQNVFEATDLTVTLTYARDDSSGVSLAGTFSGTFLNDSGDTLKVPHGSFAFVK
jgi:hypothetical protein